MPNQIEISDEPTILVSTPELKMDGFSLKMSFSNIIGTRKNQQDTVFGQIDGNRSIAVVCDGMGGLNGGELASQTAAGILLNDFYKEKPDSDIPEFFRKEAYKMNDAVRNLKNAKGEPLDGGTTIVATITVDEKVYWLSIGDSKIYLIRENKIKAVCKEHNVRTKIDEQLKAGIITQQEYKKEERQAEALTSYLGIPRLELMEINKKPFSLKENDILLLCSDGLYKCLSEQDIANIVYYEEPDMERATRRLLDVVVKKRKRAQDNTSLVIMQYNKVLNDKSI